MLVKVLELPLTSIPSKVLELAITEVRLLFEPCIKMPSLPLELAVTVVKLLEFDEFNQIPHEGLEREVMFSSVLPLA